MSRIYIVGFMGSGKTTFGKTLARICEYEFADTDRMIELDTGKSISAIFRDEGESAFRQFEQDTLLRTLKLENIIISTGGGFPCHHNHMDIMNANGITIYLKASEKILFDRIRQNQGGRPLVSGMSEADLRQFIHDSLKERTPDYLKAKHHFEVPLQSPETLVKSIFP